MSITTTIDKISIPTDLCHKDSVLQREREGEKKIMWLWVGEDLGGVVGMEIIIKIHLHEKNIFSEIK